MAVRTYGGAVPRGEGGSISEREAEVLSLIAEGRSSKEVADKLCVSKRTIDYHLTNVYSKLGVTNRVHAIRVAERSGLLLGGAASGRFHSFEDELDRELVADRPVPYKPPQHQAPSAARIAASPRR